MILKTRLSAPGDLPEMTVCQGHPMKTQFRCKCGQSLSLPTIPAVKVVRCDQCQALVDVPAPAVEEEIELVPLPAKELRGGPTKAKAASPAQPAGVDELELIPLDDRKKAPVPKPVPRVSTAPSPTTPPRTTPPRTSPQPANRRPSPPSEEPVLVELPPLREVRDPLEARPPKRNRKGSAKDRDEGIDWTSPAALSVGGGVALILLIAVIAAAMRSPLAAPSGPIAQAPVPAQSGPAAPPVAVGVPAPVTVVSDASAPATVPPNVPAGIQAIPSAVVAPVNPVPAPPTVRPAPWAQDIPGAANPPTGPREPGRVPPPAQGGTPDGPKTARIAPAVPLDPTQSGLRIPKQGKVLPGGGRRVLVPDEDRQAVVGLVHCQVNEMLVVMLPSGQMTSASEDATSLTDRPFETMSRVALLEQLRATTRFQNFKAAETAHYGFVYSCSDAFFQTTHDILESMHDGVLQYLKDWELPVTEPSVPLIVIIFPDRTSFNKFRRMPDGVLAYYDGVNNFVVLHEDPELSDASPELALKKAAYVIAHEGVHQLLHNVGVQQRLAPWPKWVSEGLPEFFCPVRVTSNMVKKGGDSLPSRRIRWNKGGLVNDLRMYDLLEMPQSGGAVIQSLVQDRQLNADGYAVAWGLTHYFISKQPKGFQAYLRDLCATGPLANLDPEQNDTELKLFGKHLGVNFPSLESSVASHLKSREMQTAYRDPHVYQTHYVVVHNVVRGRGATVTVYITTSPAGARAWKESEEAQAPGGNQSFRTEVCDTRKDAEIVVTRIMRP